MRDIIVKLIQGAVLYAALGATIWRFYPKALDFVQVWMLVVTCVVANLLQPVYGRIRLRKRQSAGAAAASAFVWSAHIVLALNVSELLLRRPLLTVGWSTWVIFGVMVAGLALRTWAVGIFGTRASWDAEAQVDEEIVARGPYRLVRRPSYVGAFLIVVPACLLLHSWVAAAFGAVLLGLTFPQINAYEEGVPGADPVSSEAYATRYGVVMPFTGRR